MLELAFIYETNVSTRGKQCYLCTKYNLIPARKFKERFKSIYLFNLKPLIKTNLIKKPKYFKFFKSKCFKYFYTLELDYVLLACDKNLNSSNCYLIFKQLNLT